MELQSVADVVRRLFSDAEFRARAMKNPDEALSGYRLDADQRVALIKLSAQFAGGRNAAPGTRWFWF